MWHFFFLLFTCDILPPPMLTHRDGGFLFDSTNVLSISELTPCVPRFSRITFHSYLGHFMHRRKLSFCIFGFSMQPYISSCQCTCQYIYYILFIFIRQQKIYIYYADKKRRNSSPAYRGGGILAKFGSKNDYKILFIKVIP